MPGTGPLAAPAHPAQPGCGFFDLSCHVGQAVDSWFAGSPGKTISHAPSGRQAAGRHGELAARNQEPQVRGR
jgi:hypothetical protein